MTTKNIISGFQSTGLFQVDVTPESFFNPKELMDYKKSRALVPYTQHPDVNKTVCMPTLGPTLETPVSKTNLPGPSHIKDVTPKEQTPVKTQAQISPGTLTGTIEIFAARMTNNKQSSRVLSENERKERKIACLKPERYGEVLTSEQVLAKMKEAEEIIEDERKNVGKQRKKLLKAKPWIKKKVDF